MKIIFRKNQHVLLSSLSLLLWAVAAFVPTAWAGKINLDEFKPLTKVEAMPEEEFNSLTYLEENTALEEAALHYNIRLPKEWQRKSLNDLEGKSAVTYDVLGVIERYNSPPEAEERSFVTVEVEELEYEIGPKNWFINYIYTKGLSLEQIGIESDNEIEAVYVEINRDTSYVVRIKAIVNGPYVMMVRYYMPTQFYKRDRVMQAQVVDSFKLLNKSTETIENMKVYGFLDESYFSYPDSWHLKKFNIVSVDYMHAKLLRSFEKKLEGQIEIILINKSYGTTKSEEIKRYVEGLNIPNYSIGEFLDNHEYNYHRDISFGRTQSYELKSSSTLLKDYEFWISLLEGRDYYYLVSLITPSRSDQFEEWARNIETHRVVTESVRRNDKNVDDFEFIK